MTEHKHEHEHEDRDNEINDEDLAMVKAIYQYAAENDLDGLMTEKMLMQYFGVDPEDVALAEDESCRTGYRVLLKEEYLEEREEAAALEEALSKTLRYDCDVPASEVAAMDLPELTDAFIAEARRNSTSPGVRFSPLHSTGTSLTKRTTDG